MPATRFAVLLAAVLVAAGLTVLAGAAMTGAGASGAALWVVLLGAALAVRLATRRR